MILDEKILRLIAIGASISANCESCLQANAANARASGASEIEIAEAIWVGTLVRRGAAAILDKSAASVNHITPSLKGVPNDACECA